MTLGRLKRTARDVIYKQIAVLESDGETNARTFELSNGVHGRGWAWIDAVLPEPAGAEESSSGSWFFADEGSEEDDEDGVGFVDLPPKHFRVEMLAWDAASEEVKVRLIVKDPESSENGVRRSLLGRVIRLSIDRQHALDRRRTLRGRARTLHDRRAAVRKRWRRTSIYGEARLNLIYFHGSRASLKSRPYYDEVIRETIGR